MFRADIDGRESDTDDLLNENAFEGLHRKHMRGGRGRGEKHHPLEKEINALFVHFLAMEREQRRVYTENEENMIACLRRFLEKARKERKERERKKRNQSSRPRSHTNQKRSGGRTKRGKQGKRSQKRSSRTLRQSRSAKRR